MKTGRGAAAGVELPVKKLQPFQPRKGAALDAQLLKFPQMSASTRSSLALAVERSSTFTPKVRSFVRTMPLLLLAIWFSSISTYSHRTLL